MRGKFIDLTGKTFGLWRVLRRTKNNKFRQSMWFCICSGCNLKKSVLGSSLTQRKSEGCISCMKKGVPLSHGMYLHYHYKRYYMMKYRCFNGKHKHFKHYGGRGITVCKEWKDDPKAFCEWCDLQPHNREKGYSIDRIDNDGNYEPGNCRFATVNQQANNKRNNLNG